MTTQVKELVISALNTNFEEALEPMPRNYHVGTSRKRFLLVYSYTMCKPNANWQKWPWNYGWLNFHPIQNFLGKSTINIFESSHQIGQGRNKETFRKPLDLLGGNLYGKSIDHQLVQEIQGVKPGLKQWPWQLQLGPWQWHGQILDTDFPYTPLISTRKAHSSIQLEKTQQTDKQTFFRGPHWFWAGSPLSIIQTYLVALINPMDYHNCPHRKGYYF